MFLHFAAICDSLVTDLSYAAARGSSMIEHMQDARKLGGAGRIVSLAIMAVVVMTVNPDILTAQSASRPDLTGTWILNRDLSDKGKPSGAPVDSEGEGGRRRPPGGGGMGPPGGGMGGRGGGVGGRGGDRSEMPNREEMERMRAAMDAALHAPIRLIIVSSETGLIVTDEDGVSTRIPLDGKKETGAANGVPFETTAKWEQDGRLRVERKFKGGLRVIEHYARSSDPALLRITSKIEGGRAPGGGTTVTRVYEPRGPISGGFDQ